ncbi:hypothetical protein O181_061876 [Austropuccinia psidii MF-1]|uniref:Uncharacterized protein n=1 Tax=Austropuccinia psidii MF-1 TaxID=1389203 RepID=A0A9Q3HXZ7_9BASI|nr:hypothetical protein [Austropuccinia psidii MF-1]
MLEKGWDPCLPAVTLKEDLIDIHPKASRFKIMFDKVKHQAKQKWDKSHKVPDFNVGDLVLVSTLNFNNIKGPKKLKYFIKPYQPADKEFFPLRNPTPLTVPPMEQGEDRKIKKVIKERRLRGKNQREYIVRYRSPVHEDEWLAE